MADTPNPTSNAAAQTTTAVVSGLSPLALLLALPQPYAGWAAIACAVFAGAGLAATQIPLPANPSGKLWLLYRALNFLALNWKYAANAAATLRTGTASSSAVVSPVVTASAAALSKDTPK
ncbi:hypothetical protein OQ496_12760 [Acetobacter suratthaniensis]|uniref:Uncharacterized protein n=1 Tax=Acetobacter suratthaniensis TaxID=1502841 RepID=A0ABS3LPE3_9PROT|nr:hypothetical protein [Acetobacter suratthaniensis]MBO1329233.1 hypothetical protein [Acetobacter suratthaniensis]MCX2567323.1 hypothetical protein [Acetobacter suratthaniensis]